MHDRIYYVSGHSRRMHTIKLFVSYSLAYVLFFLQTQLKVFLDRKVKDQELCMSAGLYHLP